MYNFHFKCGCNQDIILCIDRYTIRSYGCSTCNDNISIQFQFDISAYEVYLSLAGLKYALLIADDGTLCCRGGCGGYLHIDLTINGMCKYCQPPIQSNVKYTTCQYCGVITSNIRFRRCSKCVMTGIRGPATMPTHTKEALLIYEEVLQAYKFKFVRGFSRPVIDIIKTGIPTNERTTSGPPDWEWYFKEQYYPLIKLALDGAGFVTKIITKEDIEKLKAQQAEQQAQNKVPNYGQMFKPKAYSIEDELDKFYHLLNPVWESAYGFLTLKALKEWDKTTAIKFYRIAAGFWHPDKGGDAKRMSELNTTWAILKEGYYIK